MSDKISHLQTERDRGEAEVKVRSSQRILDSLEAQLREQQVLCNKYQDEAAQHKTTATQMRLLTEQAERTLDDNTATLNRKEQELRSTEDKMTTLEHQLDSMTVTSRGDRDEITTLRATIAALDREKDLLQGQVDERTERIAQLEQDLSLTVQILF